MRSAAPQAARSPFPDCRARCRRFSIRAAHRTGFSTERGTVTITFEDDAISILDNGLGVPAEQAWKVLTSVGASKKDRQRDAGFRGIGRLAGMAYCSELLFRTSFPGETTVSNIRFDCDKLLKAMQPDEGGDVELAALLGKAISSEPEADAVTADDHFFEVRLIGLSKTPESLTDAEGVRDYLSETAPVAFNPDWSPAVEITADYKSYFGEEPDTIDLFVVAGGERTQIFKPYGDSYQHAKGTMELKSIEYYAGEGNLYWGWVGRMSESAAVTDWRTRGLRVRVRNIQVDGTEIFETLFTQVKPSYGRFSSYYVGEIHIDAEAVIPNARRDGFDETKGWIDIKSSLMTDICGPLASDAYDASQKGSDADRQGRREHRLARRPQPDTREQLPRELRSGRRSHELGQAAAPARRLRHEGRRRHRRDRRRRRRAREAAGYPAAGRH